MKSQTNKQIHTNHQPNKVKLLLSNWKNAKVIKSAVFVVAIIICLVVSIVVPPVRHGDGLEYLLMTISLTNHQSPELRQTDIEERHFLVEEWPNQSWRDNPLENHNNYFTALNSKEYCYHFWLYPAMMSVIYSCLQLLGLNPLITFILFDLLLMLMLLWWILFRGRLSLKMRIWLSVISILSPVILYPSYGVDVFIFVFLLIGLFEVVYGIVPLGLFFVAIASAQCPPVLPIAVMIMLYLIWLIVKKRKPLNKTTIILTTVSLGVMILPYAFYKINFGTFSLVYSTSASVSDISISRVINLFTDPNFGLILYEPLLVFALLYLAVKRKPVALLGIFSLIIMAIVCSASSKWNTGMMFIHRFALWLIPVLIISTIGYFSVLNMKQFKIHIIILAITTGSILGFCLADYDESNSFEFGPVAKLVLSVAPGIYNPPFSVFADRAVGDLGPHMDRLPIQINNSNGTRKILAIDNSTNTMYYTNGPMQFKLDLNLVGSFNDIVDMNSGEIFFQNGWYDLEANDTGAKWRWTGKESVLGFTVNNESSSVRIKLLMHSFRVMRQCIITVNDIQCFSGNIGLSNQEIQFDSPVEQGINNIKIISPDGTQKPSEFSEEKYNDNRDLSFSFTSIKIIPNGFLQVQTIPAVPTTIFLDGIQRNCSSLDGVKMKPGSYILSFADVYGYGMPPSITVNYYPGSKGNVQSLNDPINIYLDTVTEVIVYYEQLGNLRVGTSPSVSATIFCDGQSMDNSSLWTNILPGDYTISFEPVDGYITPSPQVAHVTAGNTTNIMGIYLDGSNTVIPWDCGLLRVETSPSVPTTIYLDDIQRNDYALNWVKIESGSYMLSLSDVYGYVTPTSVIVNYYPGPKGIIQSLNSPVNIYPDTVTEVIASYIQMGNLKVDTIQRGIAATIYCNGVPMNDWQVWTAILPGQYTISFESFSGKLTPPPIVVTVIPGARTYVVGDYINGTSKVVP